jgi:hypothetical protein
MACISASRRPTSHAITAFHAMNEAEKEIKGITKILFFSHMNDNFPFVTSREHINLFLHNPYLTKDLVTEVWGAPRQTGTTNADDNVYIICWYHHYIVFGKRVSPSKN